MTTIRNFTLFFVTLFGLGFLATNANAAGKDSGFLIHLVPQYSNYTIQTTSDSTQTSLAAETTLGYLFDMGFALGIRYDLTNSSSTSAGTTTKSDTTMYGPAVGYFHESGFFGIFSYLLAYTIKTDTTETNGDGMQLDLGWLHRFGSFGLGAQLSYNSLVQKKSKNAAGVETDIDPNTKISGFGLPSVVFNWVF